MNIEQVLARAKRNNLINYAGASYSGPESFLVHQLLTKGIGAILGIQNEKGLYTVICFEGLAVKNVIGAEMLIPFEEVLSRLQDNGMQLGKGGDFEFVDIGSYGRVWMKDGPTMCAIWNIAIVLGKQSKK